MRLPKQLMGPEAVLIGVSPCARIREIVVQLYWKLCTHFLESAGSRMGFLRTHLQGPVMRQVKVVGSTICEQQSW